MIVKDLIEKISGDGWVVELVDNGSRHLITADFKSVDLIPYYDYEVLGWCPYGGGYYEEADIFIYTRKVI